MNRSSYLKLIVLLLGILLSAHSYELMAKPIHEKMWVGMPLKHFNALNLGPIIFSQKQKSTLTNFGVVKLSTSSIKRYFELKNNIWEGVMIDIQDNKLNQYTLQGEKKVTSKELKNVFSELLRLHGNEFNLKNFRSLSQKGYSVVWHEKGQLISLNIVIDKNKQCNITLKKAFTKSSKKVRQLDPTAVAALEPYLGKNFQNINSAQIVSDSNVDLQLDNLLSN